MEVRWSTQVVAVALKATTTKVHEVRTKVDVAVVEVAHRTTEVVSTTEVETDLTATMAATQMAPADRPA